MHKNPFAPCNLDGKRWIEEKVFEMIKLLNSEELPESNPSCENCAYAHQRIITEKKTSDQKTSSSY